MSETFLMLTAIEGGIIKNVQRSTCKVSVILVALNQTWLPWTHLKSIQISNFIKICPVGAELFLADGHRQTHRQTWRSKQLLFSICK